MAGGRYRTGGGKAHFANPVHEPIFGCPMFGTFNVRTQTNIEEFAPMLTPEGTGFRYWHIRIDGQYDAWIWRRDGSKLPGTLWELVSKELLPDNLKHKTITMEII
jgi:hypothetical protein